MKMFLKVALLLGWTAFCVSCGGSSQSGAPLERILFHFKMLSDVSGIADFRATTNDPEVIAAARAQLALPAQDRALFINGPIERGNGGHNLEWNWHFLPDQWSLVEVSIELCDGNAVLVSQSVDYWVDTVGQLCP